MAGRLDGAEQVHLTTRPEWRAWLAANHATSTGVWFVSYKRASGRPRLEYEDVVQEALCFGWVDSTVRPLDDERSMMYLAPRRRGGTWARSNKERVERLIAEGLMTPAGHAVIEAAKADGSWSVLDDVEALNVPEDLAAALAADPSAEAGYRAMAPSAKKQLIWLVVSAKREETRARRVARAVELAREGRLP